MLGINHLCGFGAGSPSGPAYLFLDTFTDTNGTLLTAHTSESGHTYIKTKLVGSIAAADMDIQNNALVMDGTSASFCVAVVSGLTLAAGQKVYMRSDLPSGADKGVVALMKWTRNESTGGTGYYIEFNRLSGGYSVYLYKITNGSVTFIASNNISSFAGKLLAAGFSSDGLTLEIQVENTIGDGIMINVITRLMSLDGFTGTEVGIGVWHQTPIVVGDSKILEAYAE